MDFVKDPPSWLNQAFMENAMKKSFKNDDLKVLDMDIKVATAPAENYASQMLRITLTLKTKKEGASEKLSVIAKLITPIEIGKELESSQVYDKEAEAFASVLPAIDNLLKGAYPDHKKLWANCYYHQKGTNYILILEDLRVSGFTLASRFEGLDMEHTVLALKSLAKLHAASLVWKEQNPEKCKYYSISAWNNTSAKFIENTLKTPFKIMSEDVLTWPGVENREVLSKKLKNYQECALEKVLKIWEVDESKLNVLLHGDCWLNNFMFKYDPNGKLAGINFVDFQIMTVNSPALDLQYLIFTSVSSSIKFDFIDLFLQTYYETFEDTLKRLGHKLDKPYTFEQLQADFNDSYVWGLIVMCVVYPILLVPPGEAFHPDDFFKGEVDNNYGKAYKREGLREVLIRGFKYFEEKGVF